MENKQPRNADGRFKQLPSKQDLMATIEQQARKIECLNDAIERFKKDNQDERLKVDFLMDHATWWTKRKFNQQFPI